MTTQDAPVICRFYRLVPDAPQPRRADRSADGMVPVRGYRYCEALSSASAFGWYIYAPLNFSLVWDGTEIAWTYDGAKDRTLSIGFRNRSRLEALAGSAAGALFDSILAISALGYRGHAHIIRLRGRAER